jgi:hypothetical protein
VRRLAAYLFTIALLIGVAGGPTSSSTSSPAAAAAAVTATLGAAPASGHGPLVCPTDAPNFETRGWWTPAGVSIDDYAGVDAEMCAPTYAISGRVPVLLHVQLRHNFGTINLVRVGLGPDGSVNVFAQSVALRGDANGDGEWFVPAVLDTTLAPHDGWLEYRLTANIADDAFGRRQYQSTGIQIHTINGKSIVADYRKRPYWEGRGWYENVGYENVLMTQDPPSAPVSGLWSVKWQAKVGAGGHPITFHAAYVNANTHAIPMVLPFTYDAGAGAFNGTTVIDTTKLPNGVNKLLLRADATVAAGTNSGLLQILFVVANGPTATPLADADADADASAECGRDASSDTDAVAGAELLRRVTLPFVQAKFYTPGGRDPRRVYAPAYHMAQGGGTVHFLSVFGSVANNNSSTLVIDYDGRVTQMVKAVDADHSLHVDVDADMRDAPDFGIFSAAIAATVLAPAGLGSLDRFDDVLPHLVSIECEGFAYGTPIPKPGQAGYDPRMNPAGGLNDKQIAALVGIVDPWIRATFPNVRGNLGHRDFQDYKPCPGGRFPWASIGGHGLFEESVMGLSLSLPSTAIAGLLTIPAEVLAIRVSDGEHYTVTTAATRPAYVASFAGGGSSGYLVDLRGDVAHFIRASEPVKFAPATLPAAPPDSSAVDAAVKAAVDKALDHVAGAAAAVPTAIAEARVR